jgi:hypothetical protein
MITINLNAFGMYVFNFADLNNQDGKSEKSKSMDDVNNDLTEFDGGYYFMSDESDSDSRSNDALNNQICFWQINNYGIVNPKIY